MLFILFVQALIVALFSVNEVRCMYLNGTSSREISFTNNCGKDVWVSFTSGAAPYRSGGHCGSNGDCIDGSYCNTDNGICFWNIPLPSTGVYRLKANGGQSTVTFPILNNDIVWSGNIKACQDGTCEKPSDDCDKTGCTVQMPAPLTMVEFTLIKSGVDFYDVSILNGFNIAAEMSPVQPYPAIDATKPYNCGNPGGVKPLTGYGGCKWEFQPPSKEYRWVREGNEKLVSSCSSDSQCTAANLPSNNVCGMSKRGVMTCGELLGYWTLDQFCGQNLGNNYPAAHCNMALPAPNAGQTLWNLLGCVEVPSCYQQGATNNCCGCADWQDEISEISPLTERCVNKNTNWLTYVKPSLQFMKNACPSAYTFPFDDMSSTYVCSNMNSNVNTVKYAINYCPK